MSTSRAQPQKKRSRHSGRQLAQPPEESNAHVVFRITTEETYAWSKSGRTQTNSPITGGHMQLKGKVVAWLSHVFPDALDLLVGMALVSDAANAGLKLVLLFPVLLAPPRGARHVHMLRAWTLRAKRNASSKDATLNSGTSRRACGGLGQPAEHFACMTPIRFAAHPATTHSSCV